MNKKYCIFLTILFSLFIGGILVGSLLAPDQEFSELENRYLQTPPKLSLENLESGKFMEDAEDYVNDHVIGRDFWVALKAWSERLSGKQENNGVYFGKEDTLVTIQIDMLLAQKFGMTYVGEDGKDHYPYIIHRTSIGCYERTLALLLEKYAGALPTWLMPTQAMIVPISEKYHDYAQQLLGKLKAAGIRAEADWRSEKMGYKIREARLARVPYMLIVGAKEEEEGKVSVRSRYLGDEGMKDLGDFLAAIKEEIKNKTIRKIEVQEENK